MLGVGAGSMTHKAMLLSGIAGLVAGALSMACGEYISVASQVGGSCLLHVNVRALPCIAGGTSVQLACQRARCPRRLCCS